MTEVDAGAGLSSPEDWEAVVCVPQSGSGTLARRGRVVLLVAESTGSDVAPLLDHINIVAANGGDGRQLVRGLALLLTNMTGDAPPFLAMSPVETGMAVFVSGAASVFVDGEEVSGRDSLAWAERLFRWPVRQIEGRVDDSAVSVSGPFDLRDGVVHSGGFMIEAGSRGEVPGLGMPAPDQRQMDEPADEPADEPTTPPSPVSPPPDAPDDVAPADFESVLLGPQAASEVDDYEPVPLPIISDSRDLPVSQVAVSNVRGVYCKNHHFNDPRMLFCAVCGINMVQQTPVLVDGTRPPLGVIVLDDGSVFQVDTNYLLGRDPDSDDLVRSGDYRGIQVSDNQNMISRIHARLELRNWDVVLADNASTNGTFFAAPGSADWQRLPKNGDQTLSPGTRVRLGHRTLAFNTHRGG